MKIVFFGDFEPNCGCSEVVSNFRSAAGNIKNLEICVSGYVNDALKKPLSYVENPSNEHFDKAFFIFEDVAYLDPEKFPDRLSEIKSRFRRDQTFVIDTDGKANNPSRFKGDFNHQDKTEYLAWTRQYKELSDIILQPSISPTLGTVKFPFFAYPGFIGDRDKKHGLSYIGNNWFRWDEVKLIIDSLKGREIAPKIGSIMLKGKWWDGSGNDNPRTYSDPDFLKESGSIIGPAAPFGQLIETLSESLFSPVLVRPILANQKMITPRMYETLAADTFPIFFNNFDYSIGIYGDEASFFNATPDNLVDTIEKFIAEPKFYRHKLDAIRENLQSRDSYFQRLTHLLSLG